MASRPARKLAAAEVPHRAKRRFESRLELVGECRLWTGAANDWGYGVVRVGKRLVYAHRLAYALHHGEAPGALTLDHTCECRLCCNPAHLEAVTVEENTRRSNGAARFDPAPDDEPVW